MPATRVIDNVGLLLMSSVPPKSTSKRLKPAPPEPPNAPVQIWPVVDPPSTNALLEGKVMAAARRRMAPPEPPPPVPSQRGAPAALPPRLPLPPWANMSPLTPAMVPDEAIRIAPPPPPPPPPPIAPADEDPAPPPPPEPPASGCTHAVPYAGPPLPGTP